MQSWQILGYYMLAAYPLFKIITILEGIQRTLNTISENTRK